MQFLNLHIFKTNYTKGINNFGINMNPIPGNPQAANPINPRPMQMAGQYPPNNSYRPVNMPLSQAQNKPMNQLPPQGTDSIFNTIFL